MSAETLQMDAMRLAAGEATRVLAVLSNESRLLLLCQLTQGERSVGELEELVDLHQPSLSQQLSVLRAQGLVTTRRDGKRIFYAIADARVQAILDTLYRLYCPQKGCHDN